MKLTSAIGRNRSVIANIQNAISFGEVQDGALQSSATIINRMSELKSMSLDVIKSDADVANYNVEFEALQQQLHSIASEKFNGVSLFGLGPSAGGANLVFGTGSRKCNHLYLGSRGIGCSCQYVQGVTLECPDIYQCD